MAVRVTIGRKMATGFGVMTLGFLFFIFLTHSLLRKNYNIISQITESNLPAESSVNDLSMMLMSSKMLIKNWVYIDQRPNTPDKTQLTTIITSDFPALRDKLLRLKSTWPEHDKKQIENILVTIEDTLFVKYNEISKELSTAEAYQNSMVQVVIYPLFDDTGEITTTVSRLQKQLDVISAHIQFQIGRSSSDARVSSDSFQRFIIFYGAFIIALSIIIGLFLTKMLSTPLVYVKQQLLKLSDGELAEIKYQASNDEIGDMLDALKKLTVVFLRSSSFANEIGTGNYKSDFKPMGKKDVLGNALINLKDSLEQASREAESRREADRISNWTTNGLANFAELLRKSNNISVLAKSIVTELVTHCCLP